MPLESGNLRALSQLLADAIRQSTTQAAAENNPQRNKTPPVSISAYKAGYNTFVQDYFKRCEWSFQLSRIAEAEYKNYILVHWVTS